MRARRVTIVLCGLFSLATVAAAEPIAAPDPKPRTDAPDGTDVVRKGIAFVEEKSLNWLHQRKCASCHHVPMMVWMQRDARQRGFKIDEKALKEGTDNLL